MFDADAIARDTVQTLINHMSYFYLRLSWGGGPSPETAHAMHAWPKNSPVLEEVRLIVRAANGELERDPDTVGEVVETIQTIVELLFSQPGSSSYGIPEHFWGTPLGQAIRHAQLFTRGDDLITHSEAAQLLRGDSGAADLMYIRRLVDRGELTAYADPREANPQHAGRVSREEVERLRTRPS